jgi:hypothetical protein
MNLRYKIMVVLGLCFLLCLSSYFIIVKMFDNIESQLFEKCRIEALIGSKMMSETIELMIGTNMLSEEGAFDTSYVEIPGSKPKRFTTRYDAFFDRYHQKVLDEFLQDPDVTYAIIVDKNGYAPTHNMRFSKPMIPDNPQSVGHNRSKRIFDDPTGITAARYNGEGTIKQLYYRDTGETIWDIAAPIRVKGKHWGAFRLGVSLYRIDSIKNQMIILIGMSLLVILSVTMLMLFLVIPRKLYDTDLDIPKY